MFDTIFRIDEIRRVKKYHIKTDKAWRHINYFYFVLLKTRL